jgi:nitroreductase
MAAISVEEALANRRSHRDFQDKAISADQLLQVLWAASRLDSQINLDHQVISGSRGCLRFGSVVLQFAGIPFWEKKSLETSQK